MSHSSFYTERSHWEVFHWIPFYCLLLASFFKLEMNYIGNWCDCRVQLWVWVERGIPIGRAEREVFQSKGRDPHSCVVVWFEVRVGGEKSVYRPLPSPRILHVTFVCQFKRGWNIMLSSANIMSGSRSPVLTKNGLRSFPRAPKSSSFIWLNGQN